MLIPKTTSLYICRNCVSHFFRPSKILGSGNTADVIFVLDCSLSVVTTDSENILQFITDVVQGLEIGPDRIRVGILSQSSEPRRSSDIIACSNKRGVLQAICEYMLVIQC